MNKAISFRRFMAAICALAGGVVAEAVVYLPVTDASLVDRSPIAMVGVVTGFESFGPAHTAYRVSVERVLKGSIFAREISVAVPGNDTYVAPGMPQFSRGDRVILFLIARPDGAYGIVELMLGAFTEVKVRNSLETRAQRNLTGSTSLGEPQTEPSRDFETFAAWIESRAGGDLPPPNYERTPAELAPREPEPDSAPFTLLGSPPARWIQFDSGVTVPWVLRLGGSTLAGGGETAFLAALNAFNNEPNTILAFTYGGTNATALGLGSTDGLHAVLMNDPFDEISGSYNCSAGGILARGGFYTTGGTHTYKGTVHRTILEGGIVTQDGADCALTQSAGAFGAMVLAHELGHAVGLGHACGDTSSGACVVGTPQNDALMRASAHGGGRGATFSSDDVAALVRLYQAPVVSPIPRLVNIATRARVQTGDNVMIAGFIIGGSGPKKVLITARGPSLSVAPFNVPGTLADPFMQVFSGATQIDFNDDYQSRANFVEVPTTVRPSNAKESAVLTTLNPGSYTVIVTGVAATSGVAIVEVFEIDPPEIPLINIATRSRVEQGDNVMIAGFVIQGNAARTVLVTARGPSLAVAPFNVPGTLADPYLRIYSGQTVIHENDNWMDWPTASQIPETQKPKDPKDAAVLVTLAPGAYTVIVGGGAGSTGSGVAIVEVFVQ